MLSALVLRRSGVPAIARGSGKIHLPLFHCASASTKSLKDIPGPRAWPLVGNLPEVARESTRGVGDSIWHQYYLQYGPICRINLGPNDTVVVVQGPEAAEAMFRAEGRIPGRMDRVEANMMWIHQKNNLPCGMIFSNGGKWKRIRSAASKQVIPRRVANFTAPLNEIANDFLDHLLCIRNDEGCVNDMTEELANYAFQGVSYFVFTEKLDVYNSEDPTLKDFQKAAFVFIDNLTKVSHAFPLYKIFPTKSYREYLQSVHRINSKGRQILKPKLDRLKDAMKRGEKDEIDALSGLVEQWLVEAKLTEDEAISLSCDMLAAGVDTTTHTSSFMLHELAKNPEVQERLHQEVTSVLGGSRKDPTFEDLQKMELVRNCVKETLRLYPAVPVLVRKTAKDLELYGYHIPAKTIMMYNLSSTSRSPQYFEDPLTFKPERWNRESAEFSAFLSLPFGFGPRSCYGKLLALVILVEPPIPLGSRELLVQRFKFSTDQKSLKTAYFTTLKPVEPVRIKLINRQ